MNKIELEVGSQYKIDTTSWVYYGEFLEIDEDGDGVFKDEYDEKFYLNINNPEYKIVKIN